MEAENKPILVANIPDLMGKSTSGFYELYTSPFGYGIVGYAKTKEHAHLFSKAPEMLEMLKKCEKSLRLIYKCDTKEIQDLIKSATEITE